MSAIVASCTRAKRADSVESNVTIVAIESLTERYASNSAARFDDSAKNAINISAACASTMSSLWNNSKYKIPRDDGSTPMAPVCAALACRCSIHLRHAVVIAGRRYLG